jgi:hypothetical protein
LAGRDARFEKHSPTLYPFYLIPFTLNLFFALTFFVLCNIIAKRLIGGINYDKKNFPAQQYKKEQGPRVQVKAEENAAKKDAQGKKKIGAVNAPRKLKEQTGVR